MKFENASKISSIPLDQIKVGRRARQVSEAGVALVMSDVARDGMIRVPISVRRVGTDKYELIDGAHRLEIARRMGLPAIDARVMLGTRIEGDVIEAAANIAVAHMPPLEMAISLAKWQKAYVKLHPSEARGVAGAMAKHGLHRTDLSFADLLAPVMGVTPRHINRITSVADRLTDAEMDGLRAAPRRLAIDDLQAINKIKDDAEREAVIRMLGLGAAKNVGVARAAYRKEIGAIEAAPLSDKDAKLQALVTAWKRAGAKMQRVFVQEFRADLERLFGRCRGQRMTQVPTPAKEWWTAAEIAEARLPNMPTTTRGVDMVAKPWRGSTFARRRAGRGGGWEYHWEQFPIRAQRQLLLAVQVASVATPAVPRGEAWAWFEGLPKPVQDKARGKLLIVQQVEAIVTTGAVGKFLAVALVANEATLGGKTVSARAIWDWFRLVEGVREDDRLPYLAPRHRAGPARKARLHCDDRFMDLIKSDFLRPAAPSFSTVYRRQVPVAVAEGLLTLPLRTMERRFKREVSQLTQILARRGWDALKTYYPSQTRDKTSLHPMEAVNADFHKFDVFVEWPREPGQTDPGLITRPQMCAFQDIFSGRILAWRVDVNPNSVAVKLCAGDMIEAWGIPKHVLFDNGKEFCAASLTAGSVNRFRWKMRKDDILGLFPELGCKLHFSTPYSGQSKPIERAFRDMCDAIAKDPRFDGAYTGNTPMAKPEDYGSRAIPLADFLRVLGEGIEEHNLRVGRRSEVACGRSFAAVFDEAYATAPISKATEAQRRLWLMGAEGLRAEAKTGILRFMGNEYWAAWMHDVAGERLIVRFDPADFFAGLHVYSAENAYLGHAPCKAKVEFFDTDEARLHGKLRRDWMNSEKAALAAQRRFTAAQLGTLLDAVAAPVSVAPEAKVVRGMFGKGGAKAARKPVDTLDADALAVTQAVIVDDLAARRAGHVPEAAAVETPRARFQRALALEAQMTAWEPVTADQRRWLAIYQGSAECMAERMLWEDFGDASAG